MDAIPESKPHIFRHKNCQPRQNQNLRC